MSLTRVSYVTARSGLGVRVSGWTMAPRLGGAHLRPGVPSAVGGVRPAAGGGDPTGPSHRGGERPCLLVDLPALRVRLRLRGLLRQGPHHTDGVV